MNIVVKLPDKDYSVILSKIMLACYGCEIVELPKGHGRLIDADAVKGKYPLMENDIGMTFNEGIHRVIDSMQTIIEADDAKQEAATR